MSGGRGADGGGARAAVENTAAVRDGPGFAWHVDVRFRDLDAMGHAHHSLVLIYIEEARAAFWRELTGSARLEAIDYVLAEARLRFHRRIRYPDRLVVRVRVSRLGTSSFDFEYDVQSAAGELLATAATTQVLYDYEAGASKPIPAELRQRLGG